MPQETNARSRIHDAGRRGIMPLWNSVERRGKKDRRKEERRRSIRYTADTLIVIGGVTWIDNEGTDRRRKVRRRLDRERIAKLIIDDLIA